MGSIRSNHYLTVVPPSVHPDGPRYEPLNDRAVADVEAEDIAACLNAAPQAPDVSGSPSRDRPRGGEAVLTEVHHDERRAELEAILREPHATHSERVWFVGFLHRVVSLSASEIVDIIDRHTRWANYDPATTESALRERWPSARAAVVVETRPDHHCGVRRHTVGFDRPPDWRFEAIADADGEEHPATSLGGVDMRALKLVEAVNPRFSRALAAPQSPKLRCTTCRFATYTPSTFKYHVWNHHGEQIDACLEIEEITRHAVATAAD